MVERVLYRVIQAGLAWYQEKPNRFYRFLTDDNEGMGLSEEEATNGVAYFQKYPPKFHLGYPKPGGAFPCWAMTLGNEGIDTDFIGRDATFLADDDDPDGLLYDPESGEVVDPKIRKMQYRYDILVIAENIDVTVWYYHLLKRIIMSSQTALERQHVEDLVLSGADLAPDPRYLPAEMSTRVIQVIVKGDEVWTERRASPYADQISGIHRDSGDGTSGTAGVNAGVTVSTEA